MIQGKSALFVLWNGTTCCVASRKAHMNVNFRPYFVKCYRITEVYMSRTALFASLLCNLFKEHSMNPPRYETDVWQVKTVKAHHL